MIENIQNNQVARTMGTKTAPHADAMNRPAANDLDATLQVNFADTVNQALQTTETDADAVSRARELLQSDRLTTPENIRSAAEDLLAFGI
jgi:hypothetical protein